MKFFKKNLLGLSRTLLISILVLTSCSSSEINDNDPDPDPNPEEETFLPDWQEGYLDIHHIATGLGDVTFIIFPDGTTMLVDAGDRGNDVNNGTPPLPSNSKSAGEWIADYIKHFSDNGHISSKLDYVLITHFHGDHIGNTNTAIKGSNGYNLSGITMVGEHIPIGTLIDRGWPDYSFPSRSTTESSAGGFWNDYYAFINYIKDNKGATIEKFSVGSNSQIGLKNNPTAYPGFKVQNLYANGVIWTGNEGVNKTLYTAATKPDENMNSCAIKLTYGAFSYFAGGDVPGYNHSQYASDERDIEKELALITGRTTVLKANHHGWIDSTNPIFLQALMPEAIVILVNHIQHPHSSGLARMVDPLIYEGERLLFITSLSDGQEKLLGSAANVFKPSGHIVFRAYDGGAKYKSYVLDATSKSYPILYESKEITP